MPQCCPNSTFIGNSATSVIPYTASMRSLYGDLPAVAIYYRDENMNWVAAGVFTQVQFDGNTIFVDHGGQNRWQIRIN